MESRTASSNSIGPGISNDGCAGWFEVFLSAILGAEVVPKYRLGTSLMRGVYGRSSAWSESLSAEYGVLREGKGGFWSRCLCMRLSRLDARDGARMMEGKEKRPKAVRAANAGIARMTFGQCKCFWWMENYNGDLQTTTGDSLYEEILFCRWARFWCIDSRSDFYPCN